MIIQVKHQEPVIVKVTEVKLPYYFLTNEYEHSKIGRASCRERVLRLV